MPQKDAGSPAVFCGIYHFMTGCPRITMDNSEMKINEKIWHIEKSRIPLKRRKESYN
ncbi:MULTISPECIES: hypothetical protein [unclassified Clostridium]|jgi:hypothetical protein|uniref:hypothetical protein n=2 Tax=Bacillota TaxID=1239 RepID=UPI001486C8E4|nr:MULTISPECIES: hypothetical protein [unclassified Clostridium]